MAENDLWGELPKPSTDEHPKQVLELQSKLLAEKTAGLLEGELLIDSARRGRCDFFARLRIICPALANYRYAVLDAAYNFLDPYPAYVMEPGYGTEDEFEVSNLKEFKASVEAILKSERVRNAIAAMLREATSSTPMYDDRSDDSEAPSYDDDIPF